MEKKGSSDKTNHIVC